MRLSRRGFLGFLAASGAAGVAGAWMAPARAATVYAGEPVISGWTVITGTWDIAGLTIPAGATLEFDPAANVTLRSSGSVVVRGTLRMRPNTAAQTHRLQFVNVNEANFVGGTGGPATDIGLWFYDMGMLDACGTERAGWNRTGSDATWLSTDEILAAPSSVFDFRNFTPWVGGTIPSYKGQKTEVFNLTRNVIIGGTTTGRSHVMFMMAMAPQMICHVRFENVGPRTPLDPATGKTQPVLGRYGLHFHKCGDATRGTVIESCVVVSSGSRGFVPHASHGITLTDCVTYDTIGPGYWWDPDQPGTDGLNQTHDVLYDRCAAFKVGHHTKAEKGTEGKLSAFLLGQGVGNAAQGCVAVGVWTDGAAQSAGFYWDENANPYPHLWRVDDCVAHNNDVFGFFAWQNDPQFEEHHVVNRCVAWRNGEAGISHGAYVNDYTYAGGTLVGNGNPAVVKSGQLVVHSGRHNQFTDLNLDADGRSAACVLILNHQAPAAGDPSTIRNVTMTGHTNKAVRYGAKGQAGWIDYVACTVNGIDLEKTDFALDSLNASEVIRVQRRDGTAFRLFPNGATAVIPTFA